MITTEFGVRLRAREPRALEELFEAYFERVSGFVRQAVGDDHLAEDLTQEAFLNIYRGLEGYDPKRDLEPWIFTTAANKIRDHWRRRAVRREIGGHDDGGAVLEELCTPERSMPEDRLLVDERRSALRDAIEALPSAARRTVELRSEGLSFDDISRAVGSSVQAVRKRFSRAVAVLRTSPGLIAV